MKIIAYPAFKNRKSNPYNALLYTTLVQDGHVVSEFTFRHALTGKYDIIHIHWPPDPSPRMRRFLPAHLGFIIAVHALIAWGKLRGARVVWTVHNLHAHEKNHPLVEKVRMALFGRLLDGLILMNEATSPLLAAAYPSLDRKPRALIRHGDYRSAYPNGVSRADARGKLGIPADQKVILCFGIIKQYKGIEDVLEIFNKASDTGLTLVVAGLLPEDQRTWFEPLQQASRDNPRIVIRTGLVDAEEVQVFFNACDLVVLPYKNILNSGTLLLALSFNKPVLIRDHPGVRESLKEFGRWVSTYDTLTFDLLTRAVETAPSGMLEMPPDRTWETIGQQTVAFYSSLHDR